VFVIIPKILTYIFSTMILLINLPRIISSTVQLYYWLENNAICPLHELLRPNNIPYKATERTKINLWTIQLWIKFDDHLQFCKMSANTFHVMVKKWVLYGKSQTFRKNVRHETLKSQMLLLLRSQSSQPNVHVSV